MLWRWGGGCWRGRFWSRGRIRGDGDGSVGVAYAFVLPRLVFIGVRMAW